MSNNRLNVSSFNLYFLWHMIFCQIRALLFFSLKNAVTFMQRAQSLFTEVNMELITRI